MRIFRSPHTAARLLTGKTPNLYVPNRVPEWCTCVSKYMSSLSTPTNSSVQPKEKDPSKEAVLESDPFGLGDVVGSEEKSNVLVQGFYSEKDRKSDESSSEQGKPSHSSSRQPVPEDPRRAERLAKYDEWVQERIQMTQSERSEVGVAETMRSATFGTVRIDTDNPVKSDGQFDDRGYKLQEGSHERFKKERRWLRDATKALDDEHIVETIEADHSRRMRASEFLRRMQGKSEEEVDEEVPEGQEKLVIEKVIRPKKSTSMDPRAPENYELAKKDPLALDSNVIPKEYRLPDYNALTEQDMWSIVKKTVIFENDFIFAINKPSGIPIHGTSRECRHQILQFLPKFADLARCKQIYPLHRLDKETTGVLLFAKDQKVATVLKEKFAKRDVKKVYLAVTKMCPSVMEGTIKIPIGEGKIPGQENKFRRVLRPDLREFGIKPTRRECVEAITNFKVLNSIREAAFLEVEPVTGYKHQIRVHLGMGVGCPIVGDHKYSHRDKMAPQRLHPFVLHKINVRQSKVRELPLHLHCNKVSFEMPEEFTGSKEDVYIHAKIPIFMKYTLRRLGLIRG